ncbi:MAG: alpha-ketoacid dehydrogenase subunit beta, partial [Flavobacteriales bacterium]
TITPDTEDELKDVFSTWNSTELKPVGKSEEKRFIDAVHEGMDRAMEEHDELILMGQDIAKYGGVFKVTEGLVDKYGEVRVRNTPLCESAIVGACIGLSAKGYKSMMEMQFADFVSCGFNQIVNNAAKLHWRWGQHVDTVIRMPTGAGVGAGPFHSQSDEAWFFHTPGLKIAYPAFPEDAKGLLLSAIDDPDPVMYFEHKALYRSVRGEVSEGYFRVPLGKANKIQEGNDISIITYGAGVHWAIEAVNEWQKNSTIEIIDLRSLMPLDKEMIYESVQKTGKAIILHEDVLTGGIGGEISAMITENCFEYLDAPVKRSGSLYTPVPFEDSLEKNFLPKERFKKELAELAEY